MSSYSLLFRENGDKINSCFVVFTQPFLSGKKIAQEISKNNIYSIKYYNTSFPTKYHFVWDDCFRGGKEKHQEQLRKLARILAEAEQSSQWDISLHGVTLYSFKVSFLFTLPFKAICLMALQSFSPRVPRLANCVELWLWISVPEDRDCECCWE